MLTFGDCFAGIGGFSLGLERAGLVCKWQIEIDGFCRKVLAKHWPHVKRYGDIREVNGAELERVDLIAGGFPCEDISPASATGVGIIGARSGLWSHLARLVGQVRPTFVLVENVPALRSRGLALVLQNLSALGFDAEWHCIPASALGAPHERDRIWIVAYPEGVFGEAIIRGEPYRDVQAVRDSADPEGDGCGSWWTGGFDTAFAREQSEASSGEDADSHRKRRLRWSWESGQGRRLESSNGSATPDTDSARLEERASIRSNDESEQSSIERSSTDDANFDGEPLVGAAIARGECSAWTVEPGVVRMVHGVPQRVDRVAALGRCVVPQIPEWLGTRIIEAATLLEPYKAADVSERAPGVSGEKA